MSQDRNEDNPVPPPLPEDGTTLEQGGEADSTQQLMRQLLNALEKKASNGENFLFNFLICFV